MEVILHVVVWNGNREVAGVALVFVLSETYITV